MNAGADSTVFVGVCAGAPMFSGADSMCGWYRFQGVCWRRSRFGFFFWSRSPCVCWCRFHSFFLVLVQEPLCFQVQIPCTTGADSMVFGGFGAGALVLSGVDSMYVGADSMVFVGISVGLTSLLVQNPFCMLV